MGAPRNRDLGVSIASRDLGPEIETLSTQCVAIVNIITPLDPDITIPDFLFLQGSGYYYKTFICNLSQISSTSFTSSL